MKSTLRLWSQDERSTFHQQKGKSLGLRSLWCRNIIVINRRTIMRTVVNITQIIWNKYSMKKLAFIRMFVLVYSCQENSCKVHAVSLKTQWFSPFFPAILLKSFMLVVDMGEPMMAKCWIIVVSAPDWLSLTKSWMLDTFWNLTNRRGIGSLEAKSFAVNSSIWTASMESAWSKSRVFGWFTKILIVLGPWSWGAWIFRECNFTFWLNAMLMISCSSQSDSKKEPVPGTRASWRVWSSDSLRHSVPDLRIKPDKSICPATPLSGPEVWPINSTIFASNAWGSAPWILAIRDWFLKKMNVGMAFTEWDAAVVGHLSVSTLMNVAPAA